MKAIARARTWLGASESPFARWLRAARDALLGEMPTLAAGTALYAILSTVPILAAVVTILGIAIDPHQIHDQLRQFSAVLPPDVLGFVGDQLERQAARPHGEVAVALVTSLAVALYSARGAARALISALNRAYRVKDQRSGLKKFLMSLALAAGMIVGLVAMLVVVTALPFIIRALGLRGYGLVHTLRWPLLMALLFGSLSLLYRFGPSPRALGAERHLWPGAALSTVLLALVSWGLSFWVDRVAHYALFYGTFGSVIVIILWFYLSTVAVLVGGFLNAELERHHGAPAPDRIQY